jgi:membrane-bound serine protease (ClpP class)
MSWLHGAIPLNPALAGPSDTVDAYRGYARVGDVGRVSSTLRPSGKARFGDQLVDVVTRGEFVDPGGEVEVIERAGNRVVVRPIEPQDAPRES